MVNCKLPPKYLLELSLLQDIRAIYANIFWSLSLSPFSYSFCDAQLPLSFRWNCFLRFSLYLDGLGHLETRLSTVLHSRHFWGVRLVCCLSKSPAAWDFYLSFLIFLTYISAEWLVPPQKVRFVLTIFSISLFLTEPELLSIFK